MIMKRIVNFKFLFLVLLFVFAPSLCGRVGSVSAQSHYVMIETNMGNMKVMLYDDCPRTVANFLEKVRSGYYDDTLFGRVIQSFMIQGGSPDSKNAAPGWRLGFGDIDEEIPGEIRANHIPKKGALAAPHRDGMNNSDMSMFFIVQGYAEPLEYWKGWEKVNNDAIRKAAKKKVMTKAVQDSLQALKPGDFATNEEKMRYNEYVREINHKVDSVARNTPGARFFTDAELEAYSTIGGAYHLYKEYTFYGEVVEGLEVIDKIAELDTNMADRPRKDVRMKIRVIK